MDPVRIAASTHARSDAPDLLRQSFPTLQLRTEQSDAAFTMRHSAVGVAGVRSHELIISGGAVITGPLPDGVVAAGFLLAGRASIEYARHRIDTGLPYLRPTADATVRVHDAHLRLITFDSEAFRAAAERYREVLGGPRRLTRTSPRSPELAAAWRWGADRIHEALRDGRALDNPIVAGEVFDSGVRLVLSAFGELADRVPQHSRVGASPAAVRRAIAYLEEHAAAPVTMPEVATAARVSLRSLQAQFQRYLGVTPLEHLHHIRLDAARRELIDFGGGELSVQEIAQRWGFGNSGRFAKQYSERFGERPSESRKRHL